MGASGGVYPQLDPGLQSKGQVRVDDDDKANTGSTPKLTPTTCTPVEKWVVGFNKTDGNRGDTTDQQLFFVKGESNEWELQEIKDKGTGLCWTGQAGVSGKLKYIASPRISINNLSRDCRGPFSGEMMRKQGKKVKRGKLKSRVRGG